MGRENGNTDDQGYGNLYIREEYTELFSDHQFYRFDRRYHQLLPGAPAHRTIPWK